MAPSPTNLAATYDGTDGTSYTTASFSPSSGDLLLLYVVSGRTDSGALAPSSVTGLGVTWTLEASQQIPLTKMYGALYSATSDGTSGAITITYASTMHNAGWIVDNWGGASVVQSATSTGIGDATVTFGSSITSGSATAGYFSVNSGSQDPTPGSGYTTHVAFFSGSSPTSSSEGEWRSDGNQTVDFTPAGTSQNIVIGVELADAGVSGGASPSFSVAITAAGIAASSSTASVAPSVAITAACSVGRSTGASRSVAVAITAAGELSTGGSASATETVTITATGNVATSSGASVAPSVVITAAGSLEGIVGSASVAEAVGITATGNVDTGSGATSTTTFTVTAVGSVNGAWTSGSRLYTYADTDGVPYFSITGPGDLFWYLDTDGVPYYSVTGPGDIAWYVDTDGDPFYSTGAYFGAASPLTLTVSATAAGQVGASTGGSVSVAVSITAAGEVSLSGLSYTFTPPYADTRVLVDSALWSRVPNPVSVSVLKNDGFYAEVSNPTDEDVRTADAAYIGGHIYRVTADEANALTDAGYGEWVTPDA